MNSSLGHEEDQSERRLQRTISLAIVSILCDSQRQICQRLVRESSTGTVSLFLSAEVVILRRLGVASFLYMIIFAGLEFTITFLVYNRFNWDR